MFQYPGYRVLEEIEFDSDITIYRMVRMDDGAEVLAKVAANYNSGDSVIVAFENEYACLLHLAGIGAPKPLQLYTSAQRPVLLMDDPGGLSLAQLIREKRTEMKLDELLKVSIALADCLRRIHFAGINLYGFHTNYFWVSQDLSQVYAMDFRTSAITAGKTVDWQYTGADRLLSYISPELTGRTDNKPDYRSDIYSIGMILYEWLAGGLPFATDNVLDMVYYHLAVTPEPVHTTNKAIPRIVSSIVSKCLEKMPDARYKSVSGLRSDLEECLVQFRVMGRIKPFGLAKHDFAIPELRLNDSMVRLAERSKLIAALERAASGSAEAVMLNGDAGSGKSALVRDMLRKAETGRRLVIRLKLSYKEEACESFYIWIKLLTQLVDQLLTLNQEQLDIWRSPLMGAVQGNEETIARLIPRIELIIGKAGSEQWDEQNNNSLQNTFTKLLQVFVDIHHMIIFFVHGIQWADKASLQFLQHVISEAGIKRLFIVGAFQIDPYDDSRSQDYERINRIERIDLLPYSEQQLQLLLADALACHPEQLHELVPTIAHITEGHPRKLKKLLAELEEQQLLQYNQLAGVWDWDIEAIRMLHTAEAADTQRIWSAKLQQLPGETAFILSRAAFFGSGFKLESLSVITKKPISMLQEWAENAVSNRLLLCEHQMEEKIYSFLQVELLQAAYALVPDSEGRAIHLQIGMLLDGQRAEGKPIDLFAVLDHLDKGEGDDVYKDPLTKRRLGELNFEAGMHAKKKQSIEAARPYLRKATALLTDDGWEHCYAITYQAFVERAEAEYCCMNNGEAERLLQIVLLHAANELDMAGAYSLLIKLALQQWNLTKATELGGKALSVLGFPITEKTSAVNGHLEWLRVSRKALRYAQMQFDPFPVMTDRRIQAVMELLAATSYAFFANNEIYWTRAMLTMVELTMDYGFAMESAYGFAGFALLLEKRNGNPSDIYYWGKLALEIVQNEDQLKLHVYSILTLCYNSWRSLEPDYLLQFNDILKGSAASSPAAAAWHLEQSILLNCLYRLQSGHLVRDTYSTLLASLQAMPMNEKYMAGTEIKQFAKLLCELSDYRLPEQLFGGTDSNELEDGSVPDRNLPFTIRERLHYYELVARYIKRDYEGARAILAQNKASFENNKLGTIDEAYFHFFHVLTLKELYNQHSKKERSEDMKQIRSSIKAVKQKANRSSALYFAKYLCMQAVLAALLGRHRQAEQLFELAFIEATKHEQLFDIAVIAESFARYGMTRQKHGLVKLYVYEAHDAYLRWGATRKAAFLEQEFAHIWHLPKQNALEKIDYVSVILSAQALSGEIEMDKLLQAIMHIMLQNAGAEYGALVIEQEGSWSIEASGTIDALQIRSIALSEAGQIVPVPIIEYTARTLEELVIHDAASHHIFEQLEYVKKKQLKSVLCLPIMHQSKLVCVLYLENALSTGVFKQERLNVLRLLSAQGAISLSNAKLYSSIQYLKNSLEDQVVQRTRSLERSMETTSEALAEMTVYAERNRIAQEIHDIVGHTLTSTIVQIEAGKRLMLKDKEGAYERLQEAQDLVRHSLSEIRHSVHMLKEDKYYNMEAVLQQLIADTMHNTGVTIDVRMEPLPQLPALHKKLIYHALQEGLTNGIRHGGCSSFQFVLENDGSTVSFILTDNGVGAEEMELGFGLKMMHDRVEQLKGELSINTKLNEGCTLQIKLPYMF